MEISHEEKRSRISLIVAAFTQTQLSEPERRMLQTLLDNPGASSRRLSELMGWGNQAWNTQFGSFCKRREDSLWPAEYYPPKKRYFRSGILAKVDEKSGSFQLHPEVIEGLHQIGLSAKN